MQIRENYIYFIQIWRKKGNGIAAPMLEGTLKALTRTFVKRSQWAFTMEYALLRQKGPADFGLPYRLSQNKP